MIEIRLIKEFNNYFISSTGNVYNLEYNNTQKIKKMTPCKDGGGYLFVRLSKNGKVKNLRIHRLLAEHFIPNSFKKHCVNHLNGVKTDNNLLNLEWCTRSENDLHAFKLGLRKPNRATRKLSDNQIKEIKNKLKCNYLEKVLSKQYNVAISTISMIKTGKIWNGI